MSIAANLFGTSLTNLLNTGNESVKQSIFKIKIPIMIEDDIYIVNFLILERLAYDAILGMTFNALIELVTSRAFYLDEAKSSTCLILN
ncbi:hypothetical protein BpHYR1_049617 [Brachionus plicatilis]|uniref:Uncharacterized protein n=1 Tax=Brachionus plicatilis TaxID=10195 RepID=A0A3M7RMI7_BRAPC|nr:hypothetical protein BpHYR1_049617 [Brachionus plicatilis]